jgi:hypothetical protein
MNPAAFWNIRTSKQTGTLLMLCSTGILYAVMPYVVPVYVNWVTLGYAFILFALQIAYIRIPPTYPVWTTIRTGTHIFLTIEAAAQYYTRLYDCPVKIVESEKYGRVNLIVYTDASEQEVISLEKTYLHT